VLAAIAYRPAFPPTHEPFVAPVPANEQTTSDRNLGYRASVVDSLGVALPSSDRDHPATASLTATDEISIVLADSE